MQQALFITLNDTFTHKNVFLQYKELALATFNTNKFSF